VRDDSTTVSQQCPVSNACPAGFLAQAASQGDDCDGTNAAHYRLVSSMTDTDNDGACTGAASNDCVGTTPLVLRNQAAGSRAVRVAMDGYESWSSAVRVLARC